MEPPYLPRLLAAELGPSYHELPILKMVGAIIWDGKKWSGDFGLEQWGFKGFGVKTSRY
jgi:hypothetical protein